MNPSITKRQSNNPGPTVAIFCGVHGNELAGIKTVDYLKKELHLTRGTVYLVYANPLAIEQGIRFTEKNLNRCFQASSKTGTTYEQQRSVELMQLLDTCDALLDLHAYNEPNGEAVPFAIAEPNAQDIVDTFDVSIVIHGIDAIEKGGSDGYMSNQGKIGICVELGAIGEPDKYIDLGIQTAYQFLQHFNLVEKRHQSSTKTQTILQADSMYVRQHEDFSFAKKFQTFEQVAQGQLICTDGGKEVLATKDLYLLFPGSNSPIGVEAFLTATSKV